MGERGHAGGFGGLALVADINLAGGVFADQDHGQARGQSVALLESGDRVADPPAQALGKGLAVDNRRGCCVVHSTILRGFCRVRPRNTPASGF